MDIEKSTIGVFALLVLLTSILAISITPYTATASNKSAAQEGNSIKIAFFQDFSGPLNLYGIYARNGFFSGLQYLSGSRPESPDQIEPGDSVTYEFEEGSIEVRFYDTYDSSSEVYEGGSKAEQAALLWGADVLVGGSNSGSAEEIIGVASEYNIPYFIGPGAGAYLTQDPVFNEHVFRIGRNNWHDALASAYYYGAMENGYDSVAFLAIDSPFGQSGVETAKQAFEEYQVSTEGTVYIPPTADNYGSYVQEVKGMDPDLVYLVWAGGGFAQIYGSLEEAGLMDRLVGSVIDLFTMNRANFAYPDLRGVMEGAVGFCYFTNYVNSGGEYEAMLDIYDEENIRPDSFASVYSVEENDWADRLSRMEAPELFSGQLFATAQFVVEGLEQNDWEASPVRGDGGLISIWEGMELQTPLGSTIIRPYDHQAVRPMYIAEAVIDQPNDNFGTEQTNHLIVGERIAKVPRKYIDPPIKTNYNPYVDPYQVNINYEKITPSQESPPMQIEFTIEALRGQEPYTAEIDYNNNGEIEETYTFDVENTTTYTFEQGGSHVVTVTVTDNAQSKVKRQKIINVPYPIDTSNRPAGLSMTIWTIITIAVIAGILTISIKGLKQ